MVQPNCASSMSYEQAGTPWDWKASPLNLHQNTKALSFTKGGLMLLKTFRTVGCQWLSGQVVQFFQLFIVLLEWVL